MAVDISISAAGNPDVVHAAQLLREARNIIKYATDDKENAETVIRGFIVAADAEEFDKVKISAGKNVVTVTKFERISIDMNGLKQDYPEIVAAYATPVTCIRGEFLYHKRRKTLWMSV